MDMHIWGKEHIPAGPKIYATNHLTAMDIFVSAVFTGPTHVVVGPAYKSRLAARVLDALEQINAMPAHRRTVVPQAVEYLKRGESIYIVPEGDMQELFQFGRFYAGVARIYIQTGAPIIPIALLAPKSRTHEIPFTTEVDGRIYRTVLVPRGPFCINIGRPLEPDYPNGTDRQQEQYVLDVLKDTIAALVEDARVNKFWL